MCYIDDSWNKCPDCQQGLSSSGGKGKKNYLMKPILTGEKKSQKHNTGFLKSDKKEKKC